MVSHSILFAFVWFLDSFVYSLKHNISGFKSSKGIRILGKTQSPSSNHLLAKSAIVDYSSFNLTTTVANEKDAQDLIAYFQKHKKRLVMELDEPKILATTTPIESFYFYQGKMTQEPEIRISMSITIDKRVLNDMKGKAYSDGSGSAVDENDLKNKLHSIDNIPQTSTGKGGAIGDNTDNTSSRGFDGRTSRGAIATDTFVMKAIERMVLEIHKYSLPMILVQDTSKDTSSDQDVEEYLRSLGIRSQLNVIRQLKLKVDSSISIEQITELSTSLVQHQKLAACVQYASGVGIIWIKTKSASDYIDLVKKALVGKVEYISDSLIYANWDYVKWVNVNVKALEPELY